MSGIVMNGPTPIISIMLSVVAGRSPMPRIRERLAWVLVVVTNSSCQLPVVSCRQQTKVEPSGLSTTFYNLESAAINPNYQQLLLNVQRPANLRRAALHQALRPAIGER